MEQTPMIANGRIRKQDLEPYPIDVEFPDLERFRRSTTGLEYVHMLQGPYPGPTVMINALTHGNEVCGAIAVQTLLDHGLLPRRGRIILSFANVEAYARFDRRDPDRSRFVDEDFNRVWWPAKLDGNKTSAELLRARALRPLIDETDYLLDLHSMHESCAPLMVCGPLEKSVHLARWLGTRACIMQDEGHAEGTRMRDYGEFADPRSPKTALLLECGQHWERESARVALDAAARFLLATGVVGAADLDPAWIIAGGEDRVVVSDAIAATSGEFEFARDWKGLETLSAGTLIGWDNGQPVVAPYDGCVLVMPSLRQARAGVTVVRLGRRQGTPGMPSSNGYRR
jgi:predicted deacylase